MAADTESRLDALLQRCSRLEAAVKRLEELNRRAGLLDGPVGVPIGLRAKVETIAQVVGRDMQVPAPAILGSSQVRPVSLPRKTAMLLAREITGASLADLGRVFDRDHTTVLVATRDAQALAGTDPLYAARLDQLRTACAAALHPQPVAEAA